jgi:hypothetical protein
MGCLAGLAASVAAPVSVEGGGGHVNVERLSGLVLYVREGCHLCEQFLVELSVDIGPGVERLKVLDVDRDADLAVRFGLRVPVLELYGDVLCEAVYDGPRVRRALGV